MTDDNEENKSAPGSPEDRSEQVGYGKPPKHSQFKKGQSGNSKGRPKGVKNFQTEVDAVLRSKVTVTHGGKSKKVGTVEAALLRLREKALKGDPRALDRLLSLAREVSDISNAHSRERKLSKIETDILGRYDLRGQTGGSDGSADE